MDLRINAENQAMKTMGGDQAGAMIRFVRDDDFLAVYEIICYYILHSTANLAWNCPDYEEFVFQQKEIAQSYPYLVAEYEGEVIGFGYAHAFLGKESYQYDAELTIYFKPGPHHGLAGRLYEKLEEITRAMGICRLISCTTANNQASMNYQEKYGFKEYGLLKDAGYKNDKWYDVAWMEKRIRPYTDPFRKSLEDVRPEFAGMDQD